MAAKSYSRGDGTDGGLHVQKNLYGIGAADAGVAEPLPAFADGVVTGVVLDGRSGTPLRGATVTFEGTDLVVTTDLNGIFTANLPPGTLVATVTSEGYEAQKLIDIEVVDNQTINLSAVLSPLGGSERVGTSVSDEITVEATAIEATETALLAERRSSAQIVDNIGAIEISKNSGSDAAGALKRVTGISLQDNKYVYVRGLGDRYSNTQLNGSKIPTTEFEKKVVPLDLFPAELLEKVTVSKSYTVDQPWRLRCGRRGARNQTVSTLPEADPRAFGRATTPRPRVTPCAPIRVGSLSRAVVDRDYLPASRMRRSSVSAPSAAPASPTPSWSRSDAAWSARGRPTTAAVRNRTVASSSVTETPGSA